MLEPSETTGVLVTAVMPEGPAGQAGIRVGDYILAVNDQRINSADELSDRINRQRLGDEIQVTVWRDGARQQLRATLSPLPEMRHHGGTPPEHSNAPARESAPWIGAWLGKSAEGDGVVVRGVYPSGPAARAGLYSGDRIVKVGKQTVATPEDAIAAVQELPMNEPAEFTIRRDDEELTVSIEPGARNSYEGVTVYPPAGDDDWADFDERMEVPEHAMMLEQHRRLAEQHERIEQMLEELRDEVRQLRSELQQGRARN
jgi:S1-C subfamily serine protease